MRHAFVALVGLVFATTASGCAVEATEEEGRGTPDRSDEGGTPAVAPQSVPLVEQPVVCPPDICCDNYCCIGLYTCAWMDNDFTCVCSGMIGCCPVE